MKIRRISAESERLKGIVQMAAALVERTDRQKYSFGIEFSIGELVRDEMRSMAEHEREPGRSDELLDAAISHVTFAVRAELKRSEIAVDLSKYFDKVREKLKYPAQEIHRLAKNLAESRNIERLGSKREVQSGRGQRFVIRELGLRETIDGILIEPRADCDELDLDAIAKRPAWELHGEWFPYELFADGFVVVIDDDGSIFVSTANLPTEFRGKALHLSRLVAEMLYQP